jgi:ubiquinone/menaquinone biosynthesis C-methylase UbiE
MSNEREQYTMGYGTASTMIMAMRTAERHAGFFIPHLHPGLKVLDCGCGPGTITLGLAQIVTPGQVIGTEIEQSQVDLARKNAIKRNVSNVQFQTADLYRLPFEDNSFDAVFISAVLGNLRKSDQGVAEAHRVLKPGGVIGIKEFDHGGDLVYPPDPLIAKYGELYIRLRREYGHEPNSGRRLGELLFRAGFESIKFSATYESFTHPTLLTFAEMSADLIKEGWGDTWADEFVSRDWCTKQELEQMIDAWQRFAQTPGAIFAAAWCEAVAFKTPDRSDYPRNDD